ncbi:MAG: hypothetical protein JO131_06875 [Gammaproteobacteria bacterium]|nr:hypothetical protein [Gammaproteobacteria bacterium]
MKNRILYFLRYFIFIIAIGMSFPVMARYVPSYTCPESVEVKRAVLVAKHFKNTKVDIPTRFGLLQGDLSSARLDQLQLFEFDHAAFLFGNGGGAGYEVACAYRSPNIIFYAYSNYGTSAVYIGASPNWVPDSNQLYATCTYSARYCVFMKKPEELK